ncbi:hypothetical protein F5Y11DRAFT_50777 [Daldinia sp. FL1419]|nr:hypothetical protein F5Y11DRAFT_50777 [Daldinia sp. FL1419]
MASPEPAIARLSVNDILTISEAELVQYMKQNRQPDGDFNLDLDGWENLPKNQRDQLAERLRAGAQQANDEVQSRPVDPDQLAAQLENIADNRDTLPQALSRPSPYSRCSTVGIDWDEERKKRETIAYNNLVNDGGRPAYPIGLLEQVSREPDEYHEILRPWQEYPDISPPKWYVVFQGQLKRWQDFRNWQEDNREMTNEEELFAAFVEEEKRRETEWEWYRETESRYIERLRVGFTRSQGDKRIDDWDEAFAAYVEETKQHDLKEGYTWPGMTEDEYLQMLRTKFKRKQAEKGVNDGDEGFSAFVKEEQQRDMEAGRTWPGMTEDEYLQMLRTRFNREQRHRYWEYFYWLREDHGRGGYAEYVEEAKRRLAKHGFTRTFQLDKDPKRQDKLTTWIEYLNYEYSWYDRHIRSLNRLQPKYDEAWKTLVNSGVLRPGETDKSLRTTESAFRCQTEEDQATKAVASAEAAANAAVAETEKAKYGRSSLTQHERKRKLGEAHSRLIRARQTLKATKRRGDLITEFIRGTRPYQGEKENIYRHSILLQWILAQVPLIEAELQESKAAKGSLGQRPSVSESDGVSVPSLSPSRSAKDTSRKTRSGRIAKCAPQKHSGRGTPSQQSAPTRAEAPTPSRGRGPPRHDVPNEFARNAPQRRRRQYKTYEEERRSRRLAGQPPEFGMLPERAETSPLYEAPLRHPSNIRKMSSSGSRICTAPKKPAPVKGAKPQGISKSRRDGVGRIGASQPKMVRCSTRKNPLRK